MAWNQMKVERRKPQRMSRPGVRAAGERKIPKTVNAKKAMMISG